jgi:hypothetical protein
VVDPAKMRDLCESAVGLGYVPLITGSHENSTGHRKPLAFYSISFGENRYATVLRTMARTARDVYQTAAVSIRHIPCEYRNALDTVSGHILGFESRSR